MNVTIWLIQVNLTYPEEFSENLRSFLGGLIQKNPEERMSIEEVLAHPFIKDIKLVQLNWLKDRKLKKLKYTLADWFKKNDLLLEFFITIFFILKESSYIGWILFWRIVCETININQSRFIKKISFFFGNQVSHSWWI